MFNDVDATLAGELAFLEQHGLKFGGRGAGVFDPDASVSRREMVYFLARLVRADLQVRSVQLVALVERLLPSAVEITSTMSNGVSKGSGLWVGPGLIMTNAHVVHGATALEVDVQGISFAGVVEEIDVTLDLALVSCAGNGPVVTWGDSEALREGDEVLAIGNALGLGTRVTVGIVSDRSKWAQYSVGGQLVYIPVKDHSAPIIGGNSGGPLFNTRGEVVGVNSAGYAGSNIALAIPASVARLWLDR